MNVCSRLLYNFRLSMTTVRFLIAATRTYFLVTRICVGNIWPDHDQILIRFSSDYVHFYTFFRSSAHPLLLLLASIPQRKKTPWSRQADLLGTLRSRQLSLWCFGWGNCASRRLHSHRDRRLRPGPKARRLEVLTYRWRWTLPIKMPDFNGKYAFLSTG